MAKHNLNQYKETLGSAAAMVFGSLASTLHRLDPKHEGRVEIALNVRQMTAEFGTVARWECRWMDDKTQRIHTASSYLFSKTAPAMAFWEGLNDLTKHVEQLRKELSAPDGGLHNQQT